MKLRSAARPQDEKLEMSRGWKIAILNAAGNPGYLTVFPWLLAPGVAIFITVLAFNFLGDGLRDAVDTKA